MLIYGFGSSISLLRGVFVFSITTIAGVLSFLPGGIGVSDGSITFLLLRFGLPTSHVAGTVILWRFTTTWIAVGTALVVFSYFRTSNL